MDPVKYNDLRRQVLNVMNTHSLRRPNHSRKKSCPALEIPNYLIKSLEREHIEEIEEHVAKSSPPCSPKYKTLPSLSKLTKKEMETYGIILVSDIPE